MPNNLALKYALYRARKVVQKARNQGTLVLQGPYFELMKLIDWTLKTASLEFMSDVDKKRLLETISSRGLETDQTSYPSIINYFIGFCFQYGLETVESTNRAAYFYQRAAEQQFAPAQSALGYLYSQGIGGVEKDLKKAVELYQQAAAQGDPGAQCNLGTCYWFGEGVEKNEREAFKFYKLAAAQGDAITQHKVGDLYDRFTQNLVWSKSQESDLIKRNYQEAAKFYKLAANQGHTEAQYQLGLYYEHGRGVEKDEKQAFEFYQLAANQGYAKAQRRLGHCYHKGIGVEKDVKKAVEVYEQLGLELEDDLQSCYADLLQETEIEKSRQSSEFKEEFEFIQACRQTDTKKIAELLNRNSSLANIRAIDGRTPLMIIVMDFPKHENLEQLLLHEAQLFEIVNNLLMAGAEIDAEFRPDKNIVRNKKNYENEGVTALWLAGDERPEEGDSNSKIIGRLLEAGAKKLNCYPLHGDKRGWTPLAMAIHRVDWPVVRRLMGAGANSLGFANVKEVNDPGQELFVLMEAASHKEWDVVKLLLNAGLSEELDFASEYYSVEPLVCKVCEKGDNDIFLMLLNRGCSLQLTKDESDDEGDEGKISLTYLQSIISKGGTTDYFILNQSFLAAKIIFELSKRPTLTDQEIVQMNHSLEILCCNKQKTALNYRIDGTVSLENAIKSKNTIMIEKLVFARADLLYINKAKYTAESLAKAWLTSDPLLPYVSLIQAFSNLQRLRESIEKLTRLKFQASDMHKELKEYDEEVKKYENEIEIGINEVLKYAEKLEKPLHKNALYYQFGELLHDAREQGLFTKNMPESFMLSIFSQVSSQAPEYSDACKHILFYLSVMSQEETPKERVDKIVAAWGAGQKIDPKIGFSTIVGTILGKEAQGEDFPTHIQQTDGQEKAIGSAFDWVIKKLDGVCEENRKFKNRFGQIESTSSSSVEPKGQNKKRKEKSSSESQSHKRLKRVICPVDSSSTLNKGIVRPKILFGYKSLQKYRVNEDVDRSITVADQGTQTGLICPKAKTGQAQLGLPSVVQSTTESVKKDSQREAISQAFSVLFSEKNIIEVSYCFEQPDVLEALKKEPNLQSFGAHMEVLARLGQIDESTFDDILSIHGPRNHILRGHVENFYQQQKNLYNCSSEGVQESGGTVVASTPTVSLPIVESASTSVGQTDSSIEEQRKIGKQRWLDRVAKADKSSVSVVSESSPSVSAHFRYKTKITNGLNRSQNNSVLTKKRKK